MNLINTVITLAQQGKYPLLFIIYLIEGPVAGFISALISASGSLNIYIVFLLLIIAEIGADVFYYYIGKLSSEKKINKMLSKYEKGGVLKIIRNAFNRRPVRSLIFIKSVMLIAVPSLLLIGRYQSMKFKKFLFWTTIICLVKDITILVLGYSVGITLETFMQGYNIYRVIGIILALIAVGYIIYTAYKEKIDIYIVNSLKKI